ncbi:MAG: hypothetical protein F4Y04_06155 [Chloroflexi bacterium]|nr:hypothetical protein [Chloroflexota bacterium]
MNDEDMGILVNQILRQQDALAEATSDLLRQTSRLQASADAIREVLKEGKSPTAVELRNLEHSLRENAYASFEQMEELRVAAARAVAELEKLEAIQAQAGVTVLRRR